MTEPARPTKVKKPSSTPLDSTSAAPPAASPPSTSETKPLKSRSQPILSLSRARLPPTATTEKLERQAARAVKREKEEKEDRARVRDVVEGWSHMGPTEGQVVGGLEFEKGLRKTAQRGGQSFCLLGWRLLFCASKFDVVGFGSSENRGKRLFRIAAIPCLSIQPSSLRTQTPHFRISSNPLLPPSLSRRLILSSTTPVPPPPLHTCP